MTRFAQIIGTLASFGFGLIALMMVVEVVARYGFNAPTFWAHEIAGLLGAVAFLFGGAFCMAERGHMRISVVADRLPRKARLGLEGLGHLCGIIFLSGLAVSGWSIAQRAAFRFMPNGTWFPERSGTSWNTPLPAFIKVALFLAAALFLILVTIRLWRLLTHGEESYPPEPIPHGAIPPDAGEGPRA
ncbi:TRAP transporter small permease subunit [Jannaschia sp. CCS1]|uniref:TRAP transporter small permease subunit n=1 Tax=Jannaschia sp. (strain CCS1) TaxID=290400 RepID=UPI000053B9D3|nr:TRAP transporter small permease subunit [Jannaschia sp. CCS1]ABD56000.1 TRAP dicarboxylate transporter DctQ subunit [Jannaschia sp. CCS1]